MSAEIAGQGNMNLVVRVRTGQRTFILKQSRPWVEKYPRISAPFDRSLVEAEFYHSVENSPAAAYMPQFYWLDAKSRIFCMEDIGFARDYSDLYLGAEIGDDELEQLCLFLSHLHSLQIDITNREMRTLNHFHIFVYPFQLENGFDLDQISPGLKKIGEGVKRNGALLERIAELGDRYLADGDFLLHGDYFPGSWLRSAAGAKVIDPEFCFAGPREFDLGVMLAHLIFSRRVAAETSLSRYYKFWTRLNRSLVLNFAGVEILRRLLGVAQLPLAADLSRRSELIETAISMVLA